MSNYYYILINNVHRALFVNSHNNNNFCDSALYVHNILQYLRTEHFVYLYYNNIHEYYIHRGKNKHTYTRYTYMQGLEVIKNSCYENNGYTYNRIIEKGHIYI